MKKIFFFLAALMFGFAAHATVVECSPNTNAISWWLTQGDTLVLADGEYVEDYSITFDKPGVCVKAAEGAKPVIKLTGEWTDFKVTATTTFDGITFDGGNVAKYFLATTGAESGTLTVTNCEFKNWTYWAISNQFKEDASIDSVIIDNCFFHDGLGSAIRFNDAAPEGKHACNYLKVTNSTFYNIVSTEYAAIIQANSNGEATGEQNEIIIDHITLYNFDASQLGAIAMRKSSKLSITNSIIATPENKDQYAFYIYGGNVENTLYFNGKAKSGPTYTNCIEGKDPLFADADNANFALAEGSPAIGAATDGSNLGDPRWTPAEPEIEWIPMELEITNLVTEQMEVEGAKYLQLNGRDDMNDADVVLFLNNYTGEDKAYEVNAESSYMTFGGLELTVLEGSITKAVDTEKGDVYTGVVKASVTDEEEGGTMYIAFDLTMYALPAEELVITNATVTIDEELGTLTFKTTLDDGDYMVELSGYTAPGVHEGPQICLLETPTAVAFGNHAETVVADGVITLTCKGMASFLGAKFDLTISGKLPVAEEPAPLKGIVKRALTVGESTVVLTLEADGTAHIYNIKGENIAEVSLEGVVAVDTANLGDLLAISDIAVTEDGKLVATNYMVCQAPGYVDEGYIQGESRFYIWDNLEADPTVWFTSKMSSNWFRSKQGYTMAVKGTSQNAEIFTTGIHASKYWARFSSYRVIDGVFVEPDVNNNDYYHFMDGPEAGATIMDENVIGVNYQLNVSPLGEMNWIIDAELTEPINFVEDAANNVMIAEGTILATDLGKKYQGATVVADGGQVLMVAPYANADGKLVGVKVLDITEGLDSIAELAVLDLEAPVAATAAATAVAIAAYDVNITLVADGYIYPLTYTLPKPERTEVTVSRVLAYDLSSTLSEDSTTLTVNYTLNANADAVEVVILNGEEVVKTVPCKGINKGTYTVEIATAGLPQNDKLTWAVNAKGAPISEMVEVTDQSRGIYDFYNMMDVLVDNDPESEYFSKIYIQMAYNGASDGATDRADVQTAGLFIYDQELNELNDPSNVGIKPTLPEGYTMGDNRNKFHRLDINPNTGDLTYCYNVKGQPAVFAIDRANLTGEVTNLLSGVEGLTQTAAHCFDAEGALYVMDLPAAGTIYKIVDGVATVFAASDSKWVNASMTLASDGRGGLWVAQNRGQIDTYYQLAHYTKDGALDFAVYQGNENGFTGSSTRGALAYDASRHLLAQGRNGKVEVYSVVYNAETGVPALTLVATTPSVGTNIDGLHFDYAGDLYVVNSSKEKFQKFAMPTNNNACSTPAASKYAFQLGGAENPDQGITLTATGLETTLEADGSYTLQGNAVVNGDESNTMDFMLCVYPTEGYTDAFLNGWSVMIFNAPTPDAFVENEDGTFTYTAQIEDTNDGTVYNINMSGTIKKTDGPVYMDMEDQITNMTFDTDNMVITGGPSENYSIEVVLKLGEDNFDGSYTLSSESSVTIRDLAAEFVEGYVYDIDLSAPSAKAVVKVNWDGMYYAFTLTMSAAKPEAIVIEIDDANVEVIKVPLFDDVYDYSLKMTADYTHTDGVTYPVLLEVPLYYPEATEPSTIMCTLTVGGEGENDPWLGFGEGELTITTVESVVTAKGLVSNPGTGDAFDVTISGKLPETAVDNIQMGVKATKVIKNGQLIIINNDVEYSAQGQVIK